MKTSLLLLFVVGLVGCRSRLISEHTVPIDAGKSKAVTIDPVSTPRTVIVATTATPGPVNVYVFLERDQRDVEREIERTKVSSKVLDHKLNVPRAELKAEIPANERGVVLVGSPEGQKAEVKVRITN